MLAQRSGGAGDHGLLLLLLPDLEQAGEGDEAGQGGPTEGCGGSCAHRRHRQHHPHVGQRRRHDGRRHRLLRRLRSPTPADVTMLQVNDMSMNIIAALRCNAAACKQHQWSQGNNSRLHLMLLHLLLLHTSDVTEPCSRRECAEKPNGTKTAVARGHLRPCSSTTRIFDVRYEGICNSGDEPLEHCLGCRADT